MGLADWFGTLCANLQIQDDGTISSRYKAITRRLNTDFWSTTSDTAHSFYVGSYGRNTAINGFSDLDIVFELPSDLYWQYDNHASNGQSALLQAVRSSMQKTYSTSDVGADGQVVVVNFQDGIAFEVVPYSITNREPIHSLTQIVAEAGRRLIPRQKLRRFALGIRTATIILSRSAA